MNKQYLGDSVYVEFDGYHFVLTTENGYGPNNTIYLEPYLITALSRYSREIEETFASDRNYKEEIT